MIEEKLILKMIWMLSLVAKIYFHGFFDTVGFNPDSHTNFSIISHNHDWEGISFLTDYKRYQLKNVLRSSPLKGPYHIPKTFNML